MKKFELVLVFAALAAVLLKLVLIKFSNQIFFLSSVTLGFFYLIFSIFLLNNVDLKKGAFKGIRAGRLVGAIGLGITFSTLTFGLCFKFLMLTGANQLLFIGCLWLLVIGFFALVVAIVKKKFQDNFYITIFKRISIFMLLSVVAFFTSGNKIIDVYYRNYPVYRDLLKRSIIDPESVDVKALEAEEEKIR